MKYNLKDLTLDEKIRLLNGVGSWRIYDCNGKIKEVFLSDGPCGLNRRDDKNKFSASSTSMPCTFTLANTWSREMCYLEGETIAQDAIQYGADVLLGPGVNIKRTPLCGRNFEYYSEDPYLAGVLGTEFVKGVQEQGVGTSVKHYCANNREHQRLFQSSEVDMRTLHEIYLKPFEDIVKNAKPWTIMCSYNPVNGVYTAESKFLLKDVLRDKFGFDGLIMSDWGAVNSCYKSIKATLDLEMPYDDRSFDDVKWALEKGQITEEEIDERVVKILELVEKTECAKNIKYDEKVRHDNAVKIAQEGIVLLKNEDNVLPLNFNKVILTGECETPPLGGGGSADVRTDYVQPWLDVALKERLPDTEFKINNLWSRRDMMVDAYNADAVIVCTTADAEAENVDRTNMKLSFQKEESILALAAVNPNVIVVVYGGAAVDMSAWIDKVKAVVFCGFCGEASNEALADVLSGKVVPSGKLSETFPYCVEDTPCGLTRGNNFVEWYQEGIFVGYRHYDEYDISVLYPFGHGLSYANFEYSNLQIKKVGDTDFEISYDIFNNSEYDAKEVSQVYVRDVFSMVVRPKKELKGFSKDFIKAGEKKTVTVNLDYSSFAYYSVEYDRWHVENGTFEIMVGASSRDIRLIGKIDIKLPDETQNTVWSRSQVLHVRPEE